MFCWAAVHTVAELYVFAVFYGLASAAAMALFAGTVPSLTKDLDKIGTRVGMALSIMSVGPLTGPSVAGGVDSAHRGRLSGVADVGRGNLDRGSFGPCGGTIHNIGTTSPS